MNEIKDTIDILFKAYNFKATYDVISRTVIVTLPEFISNKEYASIVRKFIEKHPYDSLLITDI